MEAREGIHIINRVDVSCDTAYPFEHTLIYEVNAMEAFELSIRIPSWTMLDTSTIATTAKSTVQHSGHQTSLHPISTGLHPDAETGLHTVSLPAGKSSISFEVGCTSPDRR